MHEAKTQSTFLDKCGIWISSLCAVHCLALPVMIALLPAVSSAFFAQHWFEHSILFISMVIGAVALSIGIFRHHGQPAPLFLLVSGGVIYWLKDSLGHDIEPFMVLVGASLIIVGHVWNMRLIKRCEGCKDKNTTSRDSATDNAGC